MKIYTKTGDAGETSLLGGKRVRKSCIEIDAIGEVDELNSFLGVLISLLPVEQYTLERELLTHIQHHLFNVGGMIAAAQTDLVDVPGVKETHITEMEPGSTSSCKSYQNSRSSFFRVGTRLRQCVTMHGPCVVGQSAGW